MAEQLPTKSPARKKSTGVALNSRVSKKQLQQALSAKIEEINRELKSLGGLNVEYKYPHALPALYHNQNTIWISSMPFNTAVLNLAYYQSLLNGFETHAKDLNLHSTDLKIVMDINSNPNLSIPTIIRDLKIRVKQARNADRVHVLTQIKQKLELS